MGDNLAYPPAARERPHRARLTTLQKADYLHRLDLFSQASVEDLYRLAAVAQEVEFAAGQVIYHQNDFGDAFYLIIKGRVECSTESGSKPFLHGVGESVGLASFLTRTARPMTARAAEDTFALTIGSDDFFNLVACNSEFTVSLLTYFVRKTAMIS
jgi:CRP-like cAMP-binding protein